jgi:hypothetical protein
MVKGRNVRADCARRTLQDVRDRLYTLIGCIPYVGFYLNSNFRCLDYGNQRSIFRTWKYLTSFRNLEILIFHFSLFNVQMTDCFLVVSAFLGGCFGVSLLHLYLGCYHRTQRMNRRDEPTPISGKKKCKSLRYFWTRSSNAGWSATKWSTTEYAELDSEKSAKLLISKIKVRSKRVCCPNLTIVTFWKKIHGYFFWFFKLFKNFFLFLILWFFMGRFHNLLEFF